MASTPSEKQPEQATPPTPQEIARLARSFSKATDKLLGLCKKGEPMTHAPYRFAAIHAIELYLTAYLQLNNHEPKTIRKLQHNLEQRTDHATKAGLKLRKRTIAHLRELTSTREYVETRYHPTTLKNLTQPNAIIATLKDVEDKVMKVVAH
jgi:hypothetical protein